MYVRLKHALSALALEALAGRARGSRRAAVAWLGAYCDLVASRAHECGVEVSPATAETGDARFEVLLAPARPGDIRFEVPMAAAATRARRLGAGSRPGPLRRITEAGLLERRDDILALPLAYRPFLPYMARQVRRLADVLRRLERARRARGSAATIRKGAALFNGGLFFECHEHFEPIWRAAPPGEKAFYHGLILVAAGFYHLEKGNLHGARTKLAAGIERLRACRPAVRGVRVDRWLAALEPWLAWLESGQAAGPLGEAAGVPGEAAGPLDVAAIPRIPLINRGGS